MNKLQLSSFMKIRDGTLDGFKQQAAECISQTREKDTGTLQYDWFLSIDQSECEVREAFESSEALIDHWHNLENALGKLSELFDYNTIVIYGDPSPRLLKEVKTRMSDDRWKVYSSLKPDQ